MKNFLPTAFHRIFLSLLGLFFLFGLWSLFLIIVIFYALTLAIFRRSKLINFQESEVEEGALFSPVNGKVVSIERDIDHPFFGESMIAIRILINPWNEYGIYLPTTSEVKEVHLEKSEEFFRYKRDFPQKEETPNGLCISLLNKKLDTYGIQFIKCSFGGDAEVGVLPGDRGKLRANIGYMPFGGTALLYIPENYKIMISKSDILVAGVSIIGGE